MLLDSFIMKLRRLIPRRKKEIANDNLENLHESLTGIDGMIENHYSHKHERSESWLLRIRKKLSTFKVLK